jgi:phenylalanyl-tRNA synthetase alpha chain
MAEAARKPDDATDPTALKAELAAAIGHAGTLEALDELRVTALGKKGRITELMKQLGALDAEARKTRGAELNRIKDDITALLETRQAELGRAALDARLAQERIDVTLSPRPLEVGRIHPISQTIDEIVTIFAEMGFTLAEGPDIESDFNNFTALNIPPDHPARQMQDTFYLPQTGKEPVILRTQTSPVQVRTMLANKPPIRIIAPGRTYRCDYDQTHTPMFHQVEGLVIDDVTTMAQLKGCLMDFLRAFFQIPDLPARFRPSYFPFVEPGAEMDIGCSRKDGKLTLGNHGDWLEILGCGMVHPNVLRNCGIDPDKYQGFAFGMGIERIAMLKYGIPDLRTFFEADTRWLKHYGFVPLDAPNLAMGSAK